MLPAEIVDLILGAAVMIANDSGMAHPGGLLGVPTIAVHVGGLPNDYLFTMAPSVHSVITEGPLWRADANYGALASITADRVLNSVLRLVAG